MKYDLRYLWLMCIGILWVACTQETEPSDPVFETLDEELNSLLESASNGQGKSYFQLPNGVNLSEIPQDPQNPLTREKIQLGKFLFHETGLGLNPKIISSAGTFSCASCHHVQAGFQAGVRQGVGEGGIGFGVAGEDRVVDPDYGFDFLDIQPIRSPTVLNVAYQEAMLWNGQFGAYGVNAGTESQWALRSPKEINFLGFEGVESQAIAAINIHRQRSNKAFFDSAGYTELFDAAFPDVPEAERYTDTITGLAIAAYERSLLPNEAPFQEWLGGNMQAMTDMEKEGAILFFGKAGCNNCHTGPALNSMEFYALGMGDFKGEGVTETVDQDFFTSAEGRGGFTGKIEDFYKFKVPQLYNLSDSPFFGHGGNFRSIKAIVDYKNLATPQNPGVPTDRIYEGFQPLQLTNEEVNQLVTFLETSLHDPNLSRFAPDELPSGNCFPNNDTQSKIDLGCE